MSATSIDFSKYEQATPRRDGGQIDFSKYEASPAEEKPAKKPGFMSSLWSDVKNMAHYPGAVSPYPGMDLEAKQSIAQGSADRTNQRAQAGYGAGYRAVAPVAESIGVNVPGMEESARQGDPGGVLGHAAAVPAVLGATAGLAKGVPAAVDAVGGAKAAVTAPIRMVSRSANAIGDIPGVGSALKHLRNAAYINTPVEDIPKFEMPGQDLGLKKSVFSNTRLGPEPAPPGPPPVFSKTRLGPDAPPSEVGMARGLGGYRPAGGSEALAGIPTPEAVAEPAPRRFGPEAPPTEVIKARGLGGYAPPEPAAGLGKIPIASTESEAPGSSFPPDKPAPRFHIPSPSANKISRPVTENPVVGSLVRAMQKSGLPIADRPNLLLKGSGRVNRILGPEEELTGPLADSLRQARRQRDQ